MRFRAFCFSRAYLRSFARMTNETLVDCLSQLGMARRADGIGFSVGLFRFIILTKSSSSLNYIFKMHIASIYLTPQRAIPFCRL